MFKVLKIFLRNYIFASKLFQNSQNTPDWSIGRQHRSTRQTELGKLPQLAAFSRTTEFGPQAFTAAENPSYKDAQNLYKNPKPHLSLIFLLSHSFAQTLSPLFLSRKNQTIPHPHLKTFFKKTVKPPQIPDLRQLKSVSDSFETHFTD